MSNFSSVSVADRSRYCFVILFHFFPREILLNVAQSSRVVGEKFEIFEISGIIWGERERGNR